MSKDLRNINKNLTLSIVFISGANFVTFLILLWVYFATKEVLFLIAGLAMLVAGLAFMILVSKYKAKLNKINQPKQTKSNYPDEQN